VIEVINYFFIFFLISHELTHYHMQMISFTFAIVSLLFYRLDLYLPANSDEPKPVVIFVTGGAWIIGLVICDSSYVLYHCSL
jgi:hypothetical protein